MADFEAAVRGFAALDHQALSQPWPWRDGRMDVRYALYRTLEEAQEAYARVAAVPHPEPRRILALAQRALGDLRGLLTALPADALDAAPRAGEWSIRATLHHVLVVERRYALQTRYAVERTDADPMRIAEERLPSPEAIEAGGDIDSLLARLAEARAETDRALGDLAPAAMSRPTQWVKSTSTSASASIASPPTSSSTPCNARRRWRRWGWPRPRADGSCGGSPPRWASWRDWARRRRRASWRRAWPIAWPRCRRHE